MHKAQYIAAVDMGTNSFHMIIAKVEVGGTFRIIDRMKHWVRLGDGVDHRGRLDEEAISRMLESLSFFKQLAESYDAEIHCIATSAMRDAPNRHVIAQRIFQALGLRIEIIHGEEEARLVFQGVCSEGYINEHAAYIIDIGGGSTEVIVGNKNDGVLVAESFNMGARRYSRSFFTSQHYTSRQLKRCQYAVASKIQALTSTYIPYPVQCVYGTSGTIRTLAEITSRFCNRNDTTQLFLEDLISIRPQLITAIKSNQLPSSIEQERSSTLIAGSIILEEIMRTLCIQSLRVCPSALREGIVFDRVIMLGRLLIHPIKASTAAMAQQFKLDTNQIARVTHTSTLLFKTYAPTLSLNQEAQNLLMAACQLHELGLTISHKKIHLHGSYMIAHSNLTGITQRQQQMLAAVVRFHRKAIPSPKHKDLKHMQQHDIQTTMALAAILRLAAALNRTRGKEVVEITFQETEKVHLWLFKATWYEEHDICIWNANQEKRPLNKLLGKKIKFQTT